MSALRPIRERLLVVFGESTGHPLDPSPRLAPVSGSVFARATVALCVAGLAISGAAEALPPLGATLPNARVEDPDGRAVDLHALAGARRPILIVYEDKGSAAQNDAFKRELAARAAGDRYRGAVVLLAVADVSAYDFWPVRGFVRDAIRDEARKQQTPIYCDWTAGFRQALRLNRGASNVVLLDGGGRVVFARAGTLSPAERQAIFELLRVEIARDAH